MNREKEKGLGFIRPERAHGGLGAGEEEGVGLGFAIGYGRQWMS
jgi:hypothetical protein